MKQCRRCSGVSYLVPVRFAEEGRVVGLVVLYSVYGTTCPARSSYFHSATSDFSLWIRISWAASSSCLVFVHYWRLHVGPFLQYNSFPYSCFA